MHGGKVQHKYSGLGSVLYADKAEINYCSTSPNAFQSNSSRLFCIVVTCAHVYCWSGHFWICLFFMSEHACGFFGCEFLISHFCRVQSMVNEDRIQFESKTLHNLIGLCIESKAEHLCICPARN